MGLAWGSIFGLLLSTAALAACGGSATGPQLLLPPLPDTVPALLVVGSAATPNASEAALRARLEARGYRVRVADDDSLPTTPTGGVRLVVVSKSVRSTTVGTRLNDLAAGIVTWEDNLQDEILGTVGGQSHYTSDRLDVEATGGHPLAAGLPPQDDLVFYGRVAEGVTELTWGEPDRSNPAVVVVAANERGARDVHYYAYGRGALLDDGRTAPGRRVFFPLYDDSFVHLTPAGLALFDAAVDWAAGR